MLEITPFKFWERVDSLLEKKGLTLGDFSKGINQQYKTVTTWRNRDVFPRSEYLAEIAMYLGTTIDWLMTGNYVDSLTQEQIAVKEDPDIRYMVRLMMKDKSTLSLISALLQRNDQSMNSYGFSG